MRYALLFIVLFFQTPAHADLATGLVAYWKLDESSGDAVDQVGSNTLTDNNTCDATTGILNNGRAFVEANSEKLSITDNADLSFGDDDMTISFWIYQGAFTLNRAIIGKWDWGVASNHEYVVYVSSGPAITFAVSTSGTSAAASVSTAALSTDTWYHVVVRHDTTANQISITVNDGTPVTQSHSGGIRDGTHAFEVGASNTTYNNISRFDEIGVWGRLLTDEEVGQLYNSGSGLSYDSFGGGGSPLLLQLLLTSVVLTTSIVVLCLRRR